MDNLPRILQYMPALCAQVRRVAIAAGEACMDHFQPGGMSDGITTKTDGSHVTLADMASEAIIAKGLAEIAPGILMVGEEGVSAGNGPTTLDGHDYYWLVDPLDATAAFIKGLPDFSVNIALMHHHQPILGVVYGPHNGEMYAAHGPGTAIKWTLDNPRDKPIKVRQPPSAGLTVMTSIFYTSPKMDKFLEEYKVEKTIRRGSALKFCAIAAGKADLYPRLGPTCEWDTAAGDAILRAAGGQILTMDGAPLTYGKIDQNFVNPGFIAQG
ncbi:MAG: 3'(2'),5'-bisphosphate nucleotidase CysQ [Pseudomonadota bacterium]